jgi:hypothetical protein
MVLLQAGSLLASTCLPAVEILDPDPGDKLRGCVGTTPHVVCTLHFKANNTSQGCEGRALKTWALNYRNEPKYGANWSEPYPTEEWKGGLSFCTFKLENGDGTLKAKVWDTKGALGIDEQNNPVDNAYIISVGRGTETDPGTVTWKWWADDHWSVDGAWCKSTCGDTTLSRGPCTTWGGGYDPGNQVTGYCTGSTGDRPWCNHDAPHTYCENGDTPWYRKSDPNDERSYPVISAVYGSDACTNLGRRAGNSLCGIRVAPPSKVSTVSGTASGFTGER